MASTREQLATCRAALAVAKTSVADLKSKNADLEAKVTSLQQQLAAATKPTPTPTPDPTPDPKPDPAPVAGRLFPTSPFYTPVDPNAEDPKAAQFVAAFLAQGPWATKPQGTELTKADWTRPFYVAKSTDPTVKIQGGLGGSWTEPSIQGDTIHVPKGARPAAGEHWQELDGGLVIQQPDGKVYSAWRSVDPVDGRAYQWAMIDGNGDGVPKGSQAGIGQAKLGPRQGQITYDELVVAKEIPHALFAEVRNWCDRRWPGWYPDDGKKRGGQVYGTNDPPMGGHFYLTYSPSEIDALSIPSWGKVIVRALSRYGFYTYDNGGSAHSLDWESAIPSMGGDPNATNRWVEWCKQQGISGHQDATAGKMIYSVPIEPLADWKRLRVLKR